MASSDPRVQAAAHWAARFIANGMDYNDFYTTIARVQRWEEWCAEWSKTAGVHEELAREAEARNSPLSAAEAYVRAALCHHYGKFLFFEDMEQYRAAGVATVANYRKALNWLDPPAERVAIPYAGITLPGHLRRPPGIEKPPVALIVCGLDAVKEEMGALEPSFLKRGMATLSFDGPGQGESEQLPIEPEFERVIAAVIDWLRGRADVDAGRVGAVGVSLGGYYVSRAAAFETRLACAAPVGGPYDFVSTFDDVPSLSRQTFQIRSHSPDLAAAKEFARRLTLEGVASRIRIPFLIIFGKQDRLIPWQHAERLHAEVTSSNKRLVMYEQGSHVCNNMPFAWRPLVADWFGLWLGAKIRPPMA